MNAYDERRQKTAIELLRSAPKRTDKVFIEKHYLDMLFYPDYERGLTERRASDHTTAAVLSRICFLIALDNNIIKRDGYEWIAMDNNDWWCALRLSPEQVRHATDKLIEKKIIIKKTYRHRKVNMMHIRLNDDVFCPLFERFLEERFEIPPWEISQLGNSPRSHPEITQDDPGEFPVSSISEEEERKSTVQSTSERSTQEGTGSKISTDSVPLSEETKNGSVRNVRGTPSGKTNGYPLGKRTKKGGKVQSYNDPAAHGKRNGERVPRTPPEFDRLSSEFEGREQIEARFLDLLAAALERTSRDSRGYRTEERYEKHRRESVVRAGLWMERTDNPWSGETDPLAAWFEADPDGTELAPHLEGYVGRFLAARNADPEWRGRPVTLKWLLNSRSLAEHGPEPAPKPVIERW
jgi:hypothetical protein